MSVAQPWRAVSRALPSALSVLAALALCFLAVVALNGWSNATGAFTSMTWGAFGDWPRFFDSGQSLWVLRPLGESAVKAALLMLTGLSVAVAFRVGLFNIGAQGQLMVGALAAAVLGARLSLPTSLHILVAFAGAAVAGALYALVPALLKVRRGVHEVLSTIMLNWVAVGLIDNWLVSGPLRGGAEGENSISGTAQIQPTAELPRFFADSRLNLGIAVAVTLAVVLHFFISRTRVGFEWRAVGLGQPASRAAGISVERRLCEAMAISGALAGLAGAVLVMGTELKYPPTLGAPYGFDGIAMALIGQSSPIGVLLSSAFFGALRAGGTRMQLFGVHKSFPELIQGVALLGVAGKWWWDRLIQRVRSG